MLTHSLTHSRSICVGITLFSKRADAVASWMSGLEISTLNADLLGRELTISTDISTTYIIAPLMDAQKKEVHSLTHAQSLTHSLTHAYSLTHALIHSPTHSFTHAYSLTHSLTHSFIHSYVGSNI